MIGPGVHVGFLDAHLDAAHAPRLAAACTDLGAELCVLAVAAIFVPRVHVCVGGGKLVVAVARVLAGCGITRRDGGDTRKELRAEAAPAEHAVRTHERRGVAVRAQREQPAVEQWVVPRVGEKVLFKWSCIVSKRQFTGK
ncbi:uncharacterized protein PHACADRAFT_202354 [Phanerochaete carnosa HHB-10118-sp]|uniref:Uncharacterized protein n=1 Tax=Phanerochaete carnosa (strain HHB-10118-sp) TaxID=650164 RepID=K5VCN1_PHACS|nr:uncharacterized protein PHACADRAFT_202354 [Phanerochaete carnosa HHB-10118-sp]EKM48818.1 hypothetical protein PHACADRAFT_202354 [Phanerochaete carnosa HHB-10118-sp]